MMASKRSFDRFLFYLGLNPFGIQCFKAIIAFYILAK